MEQYKLYDFDSRGFCEPFRLMFKYSGTPFEDVRIPCESVYVRKLPQEIKDKSTWGDVPFLEVDGRILCQSRAIGRFLANKFGLRGTTDYEAAVSDEYVDSLYEWWETWIPLYFVDKTKEPEKYQEKFDEINTKVKEKYLKKFCEFLRNNGGTFLIGKSMSWADIYMAHGLLEGEINWGVNYFKEFPELKALYDNVMNSPEIAKWIKERPVTEF